MKTQEEELQALERKTAEAKEALAAKYRVLDQIGDLGEYAPPHVHYWRLWDSRGSVSFNIQRYSSIAEGKSPDRVLLARLLSQFPPVSMVQVKDGSTSFRPASGTWPGDLLDVCPVTVRIEVYQGPTVKFEWYAHLAGQLWQFHVEYHLHMTDLGTLDLVYNRYAGGRGDISSVERCDFHPKHGAQRIRWASGDRKTPNSFTLWWDVDTGKGVNFPELVNELAAQPRV